MGDARSRDNGEKSSSFSRQTCRPKPVFNFAKKECIDFARETSVITYWWFSSLTM